MRIKTSHYFDKENLDWLREQAFYRRESQTAILNALIAKERTSQEVPEPQSTV